MPHDTPPRDSTFHAARTPIHDAPKRRIVAPPLTVPSRPRQSTEPDRGLEDQSAALPPSSVVPPADAATLTVDSAPCPADFNGDGFVDLFDYTSFVAAFEAGDTDPTPDFNADGFLDFFDYDAFVAAYEAGC